MYRYNNRSGVSGRKEGRNREGREREREAVSSLHPNCLWNSQKFFYQTIYLNLPPHTVASVNNETILQNTDGAVKQDL